MIAEGMVVTQFDARHQLPAAAQAERSEGGFHACRGAAPGGLEAIDVQRQFAAFFLETGEVEMADPQAQARLQGHAAQWNAIAQRKAGAAQCPVGIALGAAEPGAQFPFAVVVEPAGVDPGVDEQALFQAARCIAGAGFEEGQVGVDITAAAADAATAVAETGMAAELFGEALGQAEQRALGVFVAAGRLGRAVGAEIAGEANAVQEF